MDNILKFLDNTNWQTIAAMFAIVWYFTREIRITLVKLESDFRDQGRRTDRLYELFIETKNEQDKKTNKLYEMFIDLVKEVKK